jgi:hypothetical protein
MKWMTTALAYVYWPLLYFGVYIPFIIPRLHQWRQIPFWVTWPAILGFIGLLIACGMRRTHKAILIHAFGLALFLALFIFAMSRLNMPSFLKSYEGGFMPDALVPVASLAVTATLFGEVGRFVRKPRMITSNHTPDGICQPADGLPRPSV